MAACKRCGADVARAGFCADCETTAAHQAIWHVAVGDAAHGPYTRDELLSFRKTDRLSAESFVHREGWADWRRCGDAEELHEPVSSLPPIPIATSVAAQAGASAELEAARAAAFAAALAEPVGAPRQLGMGHDPFADGDPGQAGDAVDVTRHGRIQRPGIDRVSAKSWDLDDVPALAALSASSRSVIPNPAPAIGESSGVLHVASLIESSARPVQDPPTASDVHGRSAQARPWTQPGFSPAQLERVRPSVLMGLALAGLLLGTGSILAWSVVRGSGKPSPELNARANAAVAGAARLASASPIAAQASEPIAEGAGGVAKTAVAALEPASGEATPEIVIDEATANAHERASVDGDARRERAARAKAARISRWQAKHAARQAAKARRASRLAAKRAAASDDVFSSAPKHAGDEDGPSYGSKTLRKDQSLDDLVQGALSAKRPAKPEAAAQSDQSALPETPSRDEMLAALSKAKSLVAKCKGSGMATVSINLKGPLGRASKVSVEGVDGSSRSCVESAIKRTSFPKFQQENFAVKAPFKLKET